MALTESVRLAILLLFLSPLPGEEVIPKDDEGKVPRHPFWTVPWVVKVSAKLVLAILGDPKLPISVSCRHFLTQKV